MFMVRIHQFTTGTFVPLDVTLVYRLFLIKCLGSRSIWPTSTNVVIRLLSLLICPVGFNKVPFPWTGCGSHSF